MLRFVQKTEPLIPRVTSSTDLGFLFPNGTHRYVVDCAIPTVQILSILILSQHAQYGLPKKKVLSKLILETGSLVTN